MAVLGALNITHGHVQQRLPIAAVHLGPLNAGI